VAGGWTVQQLKLEDAAPQAEPEAPAPAPVRAGETPERAFSVGAFYGRVRQALARAFPDEVWVTGEIRQVKESRGHHYLELTDPVPEPGGDPRFPACLDATCWSRDWPPIRTQLKAVGLTLVPGLVVRVRGRVSAWEGGGRIRFSLTGIDVESLLGDIAAARARLIVQLRESGLLEHNAGLAVPSVPLRIGVVTSRGSEAHRDFVGQLERSGFRFELTLEHTVVQGTGAPGGIAGALRRLRDAGIDLAVIVRGGGGTSDLLAFDSEVVARAIANAPFPVWTGIGHTGDRSVADEVANRSLITPSACGEALVARVAEYWDSVTARAGLLSALAKGRLDRRHAELEGRSRRACQSANNQLERHGDRLRGSADRLRGGTSRLVEGASLQLTHDARALEAATSRSLAASERDFGVRRDLLRAFDPSRQLARGWTITRDADGRAVRSVSQLAAGQRLVTVFADGQVAADVREITPRRESDEQR
jgi:exodeoxyribonuclease VII large subunit